MFTGLVDDVGMITQVQETPAGVEVKVSCSYSDIEAGESINVNGVCLTVREFGPEWFIVAAAIMTIGRTAIGEWKEGRRVNLERAMRADSRLGGHIVQGHVDGVATIEQIEAAKDAILMNVALAPGLAQTLVLHGSVALDGVSLTVNALDGDKLQVALIEYTLRHTALQDLHPGDKVHIETDVVGKYVQRLMAPYLNK